MQTNSVDNSAMSCIANSPQCYFYVYVFLCFSLYVCIKVMPLLRGNLEMKVSARKTDRSLKSLKLFFFCKFPEGLCNFRAKENVYISVPGTSTLNCYLKFRDDPGLCFQHCKVDFITARRGICVRWHPVLISGSLLL